jgi:Ca2+-binding RTX toxin-like protein
MDMAILYGSNIAPDDLVLTIKPNYNYGLEDDRIDGLGGNDTISTGAGNDLLDGGDGDDILFDGGGNDEVHAGEGNDQVYVDTGNDIYYGGSGIDALIFSFFHFGPSGGEENYTGIKFSLGSTAAQNLGEFGIDRFFEFENVRGSFGNDTIWGSAGANMIEGDNGHDTLSGLGGNDELDGGIGNDFLLGGDGLDSLLGWLGNDVLSGGAASDELVGGDGADTLIGGLGMDVIETGFNGFDSSRDVVRYESLKDSGTTVATRDDIYSFKPGQDKIDLSKIDANLGLKGNQAFKVVTGFTKAFGEVRLVKSGNDTLVQVDGDKDNSIDMTILVKNAHLTKADFIL